MLPPPTIPTIDQDNAKLFILRLFCVVDEVDHTKQYKFYNRSTHMVVIYWIVGLIALAVLGYLIISLLKPEWFG